MARDFYRECREYGSGLGCARIDARRGERARNAARGSVSFSVPRVGVTGGRRDGGEKLLPRAPTDRSGLGSAPIAARHVPPSGEMARVRERRQDGEVSTATALAYVRASCAPRARLLLRCRERARSAARRAGEFSRAARQVPQSGEPARVGEPRQDGEVSTATALAYVRILRARLLLRCRERARSAACRAGELFRAAREFLRPAAFLDGRAAARLAARLFEACFFTVRFAEECLAAAISRRRAAAQPGLLTWRPRAMARASAGIFSVIGARADVSAISDFHRSHKRGIASDENATANGGVFVHAIVIAGDGACADVGFAADARVAEIGKVHGLGALTEHAFFHFDEIADARAFEQAHVVAQMREWSHLVSATKAGSRRSRE